jgi:hypothetical protein
MPRDMPFVQPMIVWKENAGPLRGGMGIYLYRDNIVFRKRRTMLRCE